MYALIVTFVMFIKTYITQSDLRCIENRMRKFPIERKVKTVKTEDTIGRTENEALSF
jgi:hypothetical protein